MFWENLLDLVSTVETPAQANLTTPVRSARSVIMKKVNFVLAVLPEKKDNFICAFCKASYFGQHCLPHFSPTHP